jgi:branched-subunit amino acid aminotransferase/4-amino-4-deoxychorismate lyase
MAETLIETVRIVGGVAPLWSLHQWRLMNSSLMVGLPLPNIPAPTGGADRILRFEISEAGVEITERDQEIPEGISLTISPAPHRGYPHKLAARAWLEAAHASARSQGADDALLLDPQGRMVEATRWSVGWWDGEMLCFPPYALGGLKGVARARVAEMVRSAGRDATLVTSEMNRKTFFACNAARGVVPVTMLDGKPIGVNPRTVALARRFWERGPA